MNFKNISRIALVFIFLIGYVSDSHGGNKPVLEDIPEVLQGDYATEDSSIELFIEEDKVIFVFLDEDGSSIKGDLNIDLDKDGRYSGNFLKAGKETLGFEFVRDDIYDGWGELFVETFLLLDENTLLHRRTRNYFNEGKLKSRKSDIEILHRED